MAMRTTHVTVSFNHPSSLGDIELAAGTYIVETEEEQLDVASSVAYRRIATTILLPPLGTSSCKRQVITIDPLDLAAAQTRDAMRDEAAPRI